MSGPVVAPYYVTIVSIVIAEFERSGMYGLAHVPSKMFVEHRNGTKQR